MDFLLTNNASEEQFRESGVSFLKDHIMLTLQRSPRCILGLSGGSTPGVVYEALGREQKIDWSKVWMFLVDERFVPARDPQSNLCLLRETLLQYAAIPETQIIVPNTALPLTACVEDYSSRLAALCTKYPPDLITLGLGEDGHIASLFPPVPDAGRFESCAIHTVTNQFAVCDRISLTLPFLKRVKQKVFLLRGRAKEALWNEMLVSHEDETRWPAKGILASGNCTVIAQWS